MAQLAFRAPGLLQGELPDQADPQELQAPREGLQVRHLVVYLG